MKLWLFIFADPTHFLQSARVAAKDRIEACAVAETMMCEVNAQPTIFLPLSKRPADNVILSYLGETEIEQPGVVSVISRAGTVVVNEAAA